MYQARKRRILINLTRTGRKTKTSPKLYKNYEVEIPHLKEKKEDKNREFPSQKKKRKIIVVTKLERWMLKKKFNGRELVDK